MKLMALLILLTLTGCGARRDGLVIMLDQSYQATLEAKSCAGFKAPDGLRWANGQLYLADESGSAVTVQRGSQFTVLTEGQKGLQSPEDLVVDAQGNIYFTDDDAGGLRKIAPNGQLTLLAGPDQGLVSTEGLALAPDGSLLVGETSSHQIYKVSREGDVSVFLDAAAGVKKAESMAFDEVGNLYIADNKDDVLYLLDTQHKLHKVIQLDDNFSPESIVYDHHALFITDSKHSKLSRYTAQDGLQPIVVLGGKLQGVAGVAVDEAGAIYLSIQSDLKRKLGYLLKLSPALPANAAEI